MALSDKQVCEAVESQRLVIRPFNRERLSASSYDLALGRGARMLTGDEDLDIAKSISADRFVEVDLAHPNGFFLERGSFLLADCAEWIETGRHCGLVITRSTFARMGLHCSLSGYMNPGYVGHPPLVVVNLTGRRVRLEPGVPVAQVVFLEVGEVEHMYGSKKKSKYFGETKATPPRIEHDEEINQLLLQRGVREKDLEKAREAIDEEVKLGVAANLAKYGSDSGE